MSGVAGSGKTTLLDDIADGRTPDTVLIRITARPDDSALPFGLVSQLLDEMPDSPVRARIDAEIERTPPAAADPGSSAGHDEQQLTRLLRRITRAVLSMAADQSVLLLVDDVQYADPLSERALVHLTRRIARTRVALVMAEGSRVDDKHLLHRNGMTRQPHATHVHLHPLTPEETRSIASRLLELSVDRESAAGYWRLSGGNPLLLRAIVQERPVRGSAVGDDEYSEDHQPIRHATLRCLYAGEPVLLEIARVVAVLGDLLRPDDVPTLLQMNSDTARMALALLEETGLLDGMSFRIDQARDAVVHDMTPSEKTSLRRQTAQLLFERGAPALVVAEQLRLANTADERWFRTMLTAATEAATDTEDLGLAKQFLELALRSTTDSARRAEVITRLISLEWRLNPQTAASRIPRLTAAEQAGDLHGQPVLELFEALLWQGDLDAALKLADRFDHTLDRKDPADSHGLRVTMALVSGLYPVLGRRLTSHLDAGNDDDDVPDALDSRLRATHALVRVLRHGPDSAAVSDAEHVLQLGSKSFKQLALAITTLIYADQLTSARTWTDRILAQTGQGNEQVWHNMLHALRAEIALRLGDLPAAEMHAARALSGLPAEAAGIGIGAPLSVLLTVAAERGTDTAELLARPVPDAMFQTRIGLSYIYARARGFLAGGQPHAALSDFTMCGKLAQQWDFDQPTFIPWRSGAAEAYAALGDLARARSLLEDQLRRTAAQTSRRVRYETQAQLAGLHEDTDSRIEELHRSAQRLSLLGLPLPTARCLADLAEAQRLGGHDREAKRTDRRARELGMACGTALSGSRLPAPLAEIVPPVPGPEPDPSTLRSGVESLTKAERRVYELAAQGKPNRDIADTLFVTTSTVEQHLTRIYRKLSIKRRADLPTLAGLEPSGVRNEHTEPEAPTAHDIEPECRSERHA